MAGNKTKTFCLPLKFEFLTTSIHAGRVYTRQIRMSNFSVTSVISPKYRPFSPSVDKENHPHKRKVRSDQMVAPHFVIHTKNKTNLHRLYVFANMIDCSSSCVFSTQTKCKTTCDCKHSYKTFKQCLHVVICNVEF